MRSRPWPPSRPSANRPSRLVELRAPLDQFRDARGRLAHDALDHLRIAQRTAGLERVGHVLLEAVVRIEHAGDASLGVAAVGLLDALLGDHDDREFRIDRQRRPQAGQPAADDEHVGEEMRDVLRMERNEISRNGHGHGAKTQEPPGKKFAAPLVPLALPVLRCRPPSVGSGTRTNAAVVFRSVYQADCRRASSRLPPTL